MRTSIARTGIAAALLVAGCKGDGQTKDGQEKSKPPEKSPEKNKGKEPSGAPAKNVEAKSGGCPTGFTDPNKVGICVKLIDGLTRDDAAVAGSAITKVGGGWSADGETAVKIWVRDYSGLEFKNATEDLAAPFDGKEVDRAKVGVNGVTATILAKSFADSSKQRKVRRTIVHNDKIIAECVAEKDPAATTGPKLDEVLGVCATFQLAN